MSDQERLKITTLLMEANLGSNLTPRLANHIQVEDYGGLVRTLISEGNNPEVILGIAKELEDATQVVETLLSDCVTCVALEPKDPNEKGNIPGTNFVDPNTVDPVERKDIQKNYRVVFSRPIPPKGELHSEHLYVAGFCIGVAKEIDQRLIGEVTNRLLLEFDLELHPPYRAMETFGAMKDRAIAPLMNYIKDKSKDTFSREDAAKALGAIGSDKVVYALSEWLDEVQSQDASMPIFALGNTNNEIAKTIVSAWMQRNSGHEKYWVAQEALLKLSSN